MNGKRQQLLLAQDNQNRLYIFDVLRFIAAIFVITLHMESVSFSLSEKPILFAVVPRVTISVAVPIFFVITGFFAVKYAEEGFSWERAEGDILNTLKRCVKEYLIWTAVYYPITVIEFIKGDFTLFRAILTTLRGVFIRGTLFYSWQLWYLLGCIYSLFFLWLMAKRRVRIEWVSVFSVVLFLLGNAFTELAARNEAFAATFIARLFESGRLLTGVMYIWFGIFVRYYRHILSKKVCVFGALIGAALICVFYDSSYILRGIGSALLVISVFFFVMPIRLRPRMIYLLMGEMSRTVYYSNMYILWLTLLLFPQLGEEARFGVIFTATMLLAFVCAYGKLKRKTKRTISKGE